MPETGVKIEAVTAAIETLAPLRWAQPWDNVGLLIGDPKSQVRRILLTIDTTRAVVAEAKKKKADLILSYHPVMFKGVKRITVTVMYQNKTQASLIAVRSGAAKSTRDISAGVTE